MSPGTHLVTVTLPHSLGRDEALRRVKAGLDRVRKQYPAQLVVAAENWNGERLTYRVAVLGQTTTGSIDIGEREVRVVAELSWLIAYQAPAAEALIRKEGAAMLEGRSG
jgi:hypothetical protein